MSAVEETKNEIGVRQAPAQVESPSFVTRALNLLSSVRFGVVLLVLLVIGSMAGMLIMQQNVEGFDKYYAELSPATKVLFGRLGLFDIYHSWYFNALLLVLSLNIILASIDRFPSAWSFIKRKKLDASAHWLKGQEQHATLRLACEGREAAAERVVAAFGTVGLKSRVTQKGTKTFVFGERGTWNRLGAYAVHVALLTIFTGGFLTAQFGRTGSMPLVPGKSASEMSETVNELDRLSKAVVPLPFTVECTDIEQRLIKKDGPITADNTLDWLTRIRIKDPQYGEREALVHLNAPYDYRGYRLFQASFIAEGKARQITLRVTPEAGGAAQDVTIPRGGSATLADGTRVDFTDFQAQFSLGQNQPEMGEQSVYTNPAAILAVHPPAGETVKAYAFTPEMAERAPIAKRPVAGYTWRLVDYEKVPYAHILSIQKDPGATVVYIGFGLLALTLAYVFFVAHQRVWALIEERGAGQVEVVLGGNTNRNKLGFGDRFKRLVAALGGEVLEVKRYE